MNHEQVKFYSRSEERLNILTHGTGLLLSVVAEVLLILRACEIGGAPYVVSFSIFGASLILLYGASTAYHSSKNPHVRARLNIVDHAMIYILIAGTYTPFTMVTLNGWIGWTIFGIVWGLAAFGFIFKLFYTGRFDKLSTVAYVLMGWIIIFAIVPLVRALPTEGVYWLFAGGIFYTVGAVLYSLQKLPYNHATFHVFVLLGSFAHFIAVYFYV